MRVFKPFLIPFFILLSCNSRQSERIEFYKDLFGVRFNSYRLERKIPLISNDMKVIEDFADSRYIFVDKSKNHRKILAVHDKRLFIEEDYYLNKDFELAYRYDYSASELRIVLIKSDTGFYGGRSSKLTVHQADSVIVSWYGK